MADSRHRDIEQAITCPVCSERFVDPRSLTCIHHFCLVCLEKVAVTGPNGSREIACPVCYRETHLPPGSGVADLPQPESAIRLQNILTSVLPSIADKHSQPPFCDTCTERNTMATKYCFKCHDHMCDFCYQKHERIQFEADHRSGPAAEENFCSVHGDEISRYCEDCEKGICDICIRKEHRRHTSREVTVVAKQLRREIKKFLKRQEGIMLDPEVEELARNKVLELQGQCGIVVGQLDLLMDLLKTFQGQIEETRAEVIQRSSSDIEALKRYQADLDKPLHDQKLMIIGKYLVEEAGDPEVVARAGEIISGTEDRSSMALGFPALSTVKIHSEDVMLLEKVITEVIGRGSLCSITRDKSGAEICWGDVNKPPGSPITHLSPSISLKLRSSVYDVLLNGHLSQFILRTDSESAPIKVYNLKARLVTEFGKGIEGLTDRGRLALDTRRELYLAACDGHLTTVTMMGQRRHKIGMKGSRLKGVAYITQEDLYVVTNVTDSKIYVINPETKHVLRSFGSRGENPGQFSDPECVHPYPTLGETLLAVPDYGNHRVQIVSLSGKYLHAYGSWGKGEGQLNSPHGAVVDPAGRILVSDLWNKRVVSFWTEGKEDRHDCLISREALGGDPLWMDLDNRQKLLIIRVSESIQIFEFSE